MPTVQVLDGKGSGRTLELTGGVRRADPRAAPASGRDPRAGRPACGHARHQGPQRGLGRRQEAVEAEGHRPRPPGLHPRDPVEGRRQAVRPHAAQLRQGHAARDAPGACARRVAAKIAAGASPSVEQLGVSDGKTKSLVTRLVPLGVEPAPTLLVVRELARSWCCAARNVPWLDRRDAGTRVRVSAPARRRVVFERAALAGARGGARHEAIPRDGPDPPAHDGKEHAAEGRAEHGDLPGRDPTPTRSRSARRWRRVQRQGGRRSAPPPSRAS